MSMRIVLLMRRMTHRLLLLLLLPRIMHRRRHLVVVVAVAAPNAATATDIGNQFAQLFLPDAVVAVRHQIAAHLGQRVRRAGVRLGRRGQRQDLDVQLVVQMAVFGIAGRAQFLLLRNGSKVC